MKLRLHTSLIAIGVIVLGSLPSSAAQPAATVGTPSVAYGLDPAHDQSLGGVGLTPPLHQAWARDLGAPMSFPIVADGKVFVSVGHTDPNDPGTTITALSAATGQTTWTHSVPHTYSFWSPLAYDRGRIFFATSDQLVALDADTGATDWVHHTPGGIDEEVPTASDGVVYAGLEALDEATGTVIWTSDASNSRAPALSDVDAIGASACPNVIAVRRGTGKQDWVYSPNCSGGGTRIPQYADGKVYVVEPAPVAPDLWVFDASDGTVVSHHRKVDGLPAFWNDTALYTLDSRLTAVDSGTGKALWSFRGDALIDTAPIVVDGIAYVGSALGNLWGIRVSTGNVVWKTQLDWPIYTSSSDYAWPDVVLGAGQGLLVAPAATHLVAFRSGAASHRDESGTSAATSYTVRPLRELPPDYAFLPSGLNSHDVVSGTIFELPLRSVPARWKGGAIRVLDKIPRGTITLASGMAINNKGHIAGEWDSGDGFGGFLFADGWYRLLPRMDYVDGINDHDTVSGSYVTKSGAGVAATWHDGKITRLSPLPMGSQVLARAFDINNRGQVVGMGRSGKPVLWEDGKQKTLGSSDCGTPNGQAYRINELGQIAGVAGEGPCAGVFLWTRSGGMRPLGRPDCPDTVYVSGINESRVIVGYCGLGYIPWIWRDGTFSDPNDLLPANSGWIISGLWGINDQGHIVAYGGHYPYGPNYPVGAALLLTPN